MGMVPKNIKADYKITGGISLIKAIIVASAGVIGYLIAGSIFKDGGFGILAFTVCSVFIALLLIISAPGHRRKPALLGIVDLIKHKLAPKDMYGPSSDEAKDRRHYDEVK